MKQSGRFPCFRERLNDLMKNEQMSTTEFAEKLGLSRQTVGFYLNGDRIPDALTLRQICERCSVSADYLLGLAKDTTPDQTVQGVCRYTGLSKQSAEYLHIHKALNNGFLTRLIDDLLRIDGIDTDIPDLVLRSAQAFILSNDDESAQTTCDVENRLEALSIHAGKYYAITGREASEFYLSQAINTATSSIKSTISDLFDDVIFWLKKQEKIDKKDFQWITVDESELPKDIKKATGGNR